MACTPEERKEDHLWKEFYHVHVHEAMKWMGRGEGGEGGEGGGGEGGEGEGEGGGEGGEGGGGSEGCAPTDSGMFEFSSFSSLLLLLVPLANELVDVFSYVIWRDALSIGKLDATAGARGILHSTPFSPSPFPSPLLTPT